jgi:methionine synthase II (cobalamin-independent)
MLETTTVGSFPKPDYLVKARDSFRRGKMEHENLPSLNGRPPRNVFDSRNGSDLIYLFMERWNAAI